MSPPNSLDLLDLNQKLLTSIAHGDWATYETLCDPTITCFEPEARGQLVTGMPFHKYYFDLSKSEEAPKSPRLVTMCGANVRMLGPDAAVISYVRLTQTVDCQGHPQTSKMEETRVWQKIAGHWKHVHFHRSQGA